MSDDIARRLQITTESINTGATFVVDSEKYMLRHQLYSAKVVITGLERQAMAHGQERKKLEAQAAEIARLRLLLAHAVEEADGWHAEINGGLIEGDVLMDEARELVRPNV